MSDPFILTLPLIVNMSMRGDSKTTQSATVPVSAADDLSSDARSPPALNVAAGACGITPHAHSDPELGISYSDESDASESKKPSEASRSPAVPRLSRDLPNLRARDMRRSRFDSDDEYYDEYYNSSQKSARAPSHESVANGTSYRHSEYRGTSKGTPSKWDELKLCRLPEHLINTLSHETSQHHRIPLFDASELHGLSSSARNFCAEKDFYLDVFL